MSARQTTHLKLPQACHHWIHAEAADAGQPVRDWLDDLLCIEFEVRRREGSLPPGRVPVPSDVIQSYSLYRSTLDLLRDCGGARVVRSVLLRLWRASQKDTAA